VNRLGFYTTLCWTLIGLALAAIIFLFGMSFANAQDKPEVTNRYCTAWNGSEFIAVDCSKSYQQYGWVCNDNTSLCFVTSPNLLLHDPSYNCMQSDGDGTRMVQCPPWDKDQWLLPPTTDEWSKASSPVQENDTLQENTFQFHKSDDGKCFGSFTWDDQAHICTIRIVFDTLPHVQCTGVFKDPNVPMGGEAMVCFYDPTTPAVTK
jgi:hypothetical protein